MVCARVQIRQPYKAILGASIMLKITRHGCAAPHEKVSLISLKRAIYVKSVQLREFKNLTWNTCPNKTRRNLGPEHENVLAWGSIQSVLTCLNTVVCGVMLSRNLKKAVKSPSYCVFSPNRTEVWKCISINVKAFIRTSKMLSQQ